MAAIARGSLEHIFYTIQKERVKKKERNQKDGKRKKGLLLEDDDQQMLFTFDV